MHGRANSDRLKNKTQCHSGERLRTDDVPSSKALTGVALIQENKTNLNDTQQKQLNIVCFSTTNVHFHYYQ